MSIGCQLGTVCGAPYGLRRTFITLLISKGIDIVTVTDLAGHSMVSTTVNMYAHSLQSKKAAAIGEISDLIGFEKII